MDSKALRASPSIDKAISVDVVVVPAHQREHERRRDSDRRRITAFGVTAERLAKANKDAIVMHPGPMNRDVEIASDVADGPQSLIQRQVTNGVAVRSRPSSPPSPATCRLRRHFQ